MKFHTFVSALALGSAILSPFANASEWEREPIRPIPPTPKEGTKLPEVDVDPASCPSSNITVTVWTDYYHYESSWELVELCDGNTTVLEGGPYDDNFTEYTHQYCTELPLGVGSYMFNFYDSYGDGLFDDGNYTVTYDGEMVVSGGGNFGYNISHPINGTCETEEPTEAPTYSSDGCRDSPTEFQLIPEGGGKVSYKCAYLTSMDDEDPIYTKAKCTNNPLLASHCPKSCGACATHKCENSIAKFYKGGKKRSCDDDKISGKCDSGSVKKTCRETCNFCDDIE